MTKINELKTTKTHIGEFPIIRLKNSIRIVNFSSLHSYTFDTGEVLPGCDSEVTYKYKLECSHEYEPRWINVNEHETSAYGEDYMRASMGDPEYHDVRIHYSLSEPIQDMLRLLANRHYVDIILVPFPVRQCIKEEYDELEQIVPPSEENNILYKTRTCKKVDPRDISKGISSVEFCA
tara:strand:- start:2138 stop:2671 length:534 start_codon:yes stop_codon:yes gene_type:complete